MAAFTVGLLGLAGTATADTPASWQNDPRVSGLDWALVLLIIPLAAAATITLLVMLGTRNSTPKNDQQWAGKQEWFGGPADKREAAHGSEATGGAGADF